MIDKKPVNVLWIRIRYVKFCSRAIRNADFPQCGSVSRRLIDKITQINVTTCFPMDIKMLMHIVIINLFLKKKEGDMYLGLW